MWHSTLNKTKGKKHIIVPIDAENNYQNFVWHNLTFHNKHHQQARNKRPLLQHNIGHTWQGNVIVNTTYLIKNKKQKIESLSTKNRNEARMPADSHYFYSTLYCKS